MSDRDGRGQITEYRLAREAGIRVSTARHYLEGRWSRISSWARGRIRDALARLGLS